MWWYKQRPDDFVKSPSAALRFILRHCGVLLCTPHSSTCLFRQAFARLASGAFYCVVHTDDFLGSRRDFVLHSCLLLLFCVMAGCGYHLRADGEPVGITLENLAIPLFTSTSTDIGFEANFTRIVREEFISHAKVPLVPEETARTVLVGRIIEIRTDPIGYDSLGAFTVTKTRRLKIRLDVQLIDRVQGKVIWHDASIEERSSFQVETDPLATRFSQEQALEKLARRAAKKMYQRTLERF